MADETYNGWTNWDTWHTVLLMENDEQLQQKMVAWSKNFARKKKRGTFKMELAEKAVRKYIVPEARREEKRLIDDPYYGGELIDPKKVDAHEIVEHLLSYQNVE